MFSHRPNYFRMSLYIFSYIQTFFILDTLTIYATLLHLPNVGLTMSVIAIFSNAHIHALCTLTTHALTLSFLICNRLLKIYYCDCACIIPTLATDFIR
jgi:hypothetical protein